IPGEHAFLYGRSTDIAASGQVDIWSPINLLIPLFQDSLSFYALKIIFYFWLLGLAFSLFLRSLKLHPAIAIFGGVSYQWAGPMIAWLSWAVIDGAWAWLPLSLLAAWQYITQAPRLRWLILGGLGWWGMVSTGH